MVGAVIRASDHDVVIVLCERKDSLAKDNSLPGDLMPEQVVQLRSRNDVHTVAVTVERTCVG